MKTSARQRLKHFERQTRFQMHAALMVSIAILSFAAGFNF